MTLPHITKQQQAILILIYHYRFLNRIQIQAFLSHKNKKTINTWLPDLVEKEYLKRIYSKSFLEKTKPAIYYLGANGIRFIKTLGVTNLTELRKRYREDSRTTSFIQQQVLLAQIAITFCAKNATSKTLHTPYSSTEFAESDSPYYFLTELNPKLVLVKEKKEGLTVFLLELFPPALPRYSIRKRIRTYFEYLESGEWESYMDCPLPITLFVCPDKKTMIYTKRYVKKIKSDEIFPDELVFWFTTEEDVRVRGISEKIWEVVD